MRIYFICPHSSFVPDLVTRVDSLVDSFEELGHSVYYPPLDIKQQGGAELYKCTIKREVMEKADKVFLAWDGEDQDCVFDLGMAFCLRKPIVALSGLVPPEAEMPVMFARMISDWEQIGPEQFSASKG